MCNAHGHPPGCTCGWGGDGHLGASGWGSGSWSLGDLARRHGTTFCIPVCCRYCGQEIFIYANRHGSVVLFDELGWPWAKHDCRGARRYLGYSGADHPGRFLNTLLDVSSEWFQALLLELAGGRGSRYATDLDVPPYVLEASFTAKQPAFPFLREAAAQLRLPQGLFFPFVCRECRQDVIVHVDRNGAMMLLGAGSPGQRRSLHHCAAVRTHEAVIHRALPAYLSWKTLIGTLTVPAAGARPPGSKVILGFVSDCQDGQLLLRPLMGALQGVWVATPLKVPRMTLVGVRSAGAEALSLDQLRDGWPAVPAAAVPDDRNLWKAKAVPNPLGKTGRPKMASRVVPMPDPKSDVLYPIRVPIQPLCRKKGAGVADRMTRRIALNSYPPELRDPGVRDCFIRLALDGLSRDREAFWDSLFRQYGWHVSGLVPLEDACQFVAILSDAREDGQRREACFAELRTLTAGIRTTISAQLKSSI